MNKLKEWDDKHEKLSAFVMEEILGSSDYADAVVIRKVITPVIIRCCGQRPTQEEKE
jgi:hypothetical protein